MLSLMQPKAWITDFLLEFLLLAVFGAALDDGRALAVEFLEFFLTFFFVGAEADANSDDDGVDELLALRPADVTAALRTPCPAQKAASNKAANDDRAHRVESAMNTADVLWGARPHGDRTLATDTLYAALDPKAAHQAARKRTDGAGTCMPSAPLASSVAVWSGASVANVQQWVARLPQGPCNEEQRHFCKLVATRVETELAARSWIAGHATCQRPACAALITQGLSPEAIQLAECDTCATDRRSRMLVAQGDADSRFQNEFSDAVAIFGTNDIKYHVNKVRALQWANARGHLPYLFVARDLASAAVLQEKPNLTAEKLQWLQRHDKECGGLYGVLLLCVGMPVRATDHLDRKRGILKGTKGYVVGWSAIADATPAPEGMVCNNLPAVVYVKFDTATSWQISGVPDANVYPVVTCRRVWYLALLPRLRPEAAGALV
ncbi:unnamed protein product, partial [Cladocopium goreaui]